MSYGDYLANISPGKAQKEGSEAPAVPAIHSLSLFHYYLNTLIGARYAAFSSLSDAHKEELFTECIKDANRLMQTLSKENII